MDSSFHAIYNELMRVHFKPTTDLGKRSAWLIVAFAVLLGAFYILVASGQRGGDTFFSNPILTVPMLLAAASGIAAFITGLISIIKKKERSVAVYLAVTFGLFVILFALGELIFPH
jgi:hypothetical protein